MKNENEINLQNNQNYSGIFPGIKSIYFVDGIPLEAGIERLGTCPDFSKTVEKAMNKNNNYFWLKCRGCTHVKLFFNARENSLDVIGNCPIE